MKYKVGDKVRVKSEKWWMDNAVMDDAATFMYGEPFPYIKCGKESFLEDMVPYTGAVATIEGVSPFGEYEINLDEGEWSWTDEMFEDGVL
jgi:hypothetical protein